MKHSIDHNAIHVLLVFCFVLVSRGNGHSQHILYAPEAISSLAVCCVPAHLVWAGVRVGPLELSLGDSKVGNPSPLFYNLRGSFVHA